MGTREPSAANTFRLSEIKVLHELCKKAMRIPDLQTMAKSEAFVSAFQKVQRMRDKAEGTKR